MKCLLVTATFLIALTTPAIAQPFSRSAPTKSVTSRGVTYWPLVCKGDVYEVMVGDLRGNRRADRNFSVAVAFDKGTTAAGLQGQNLQRGTCSWVDRGMDPNEPHYIFDTLSAPQIVYRIEGDGRISAQRLEGLPYAALKRPGVFYIYVSQNSSGTGFQVYSAISPTSDSNGLPIGDYLPVVEIRD